jgi:hypothetical protein
MKEPTMTTRREFLVTVAGVGATGTLSGCNLSNESSLAIILEEVPPQDLGQSDVVTVEELEPARRAVVVKGLDNGTTVYGRQLLDTNEIILDNGSYFAVEFRENGTEVVQRPVLESTNVSEANGSVGGREGLPPNDIKTLRCVFTKSHRENEAPCVIYGGTGSAFWPEPDFRYVEHGDGEYYRLETSKQNVSLTRYEYAFEHVADTQSELAATSHEIESLSTSQLQISHPSSERFFAQLPQKASTGSHRHRTQMHSLTLLLRYIQRGRQPKRCMSGLTANIMKRAS